MIAKDVKPPEKRVVVEVSQAKKPKIHSDLGTVVTDRLRDGIRQLFGEKGVPVPIGLSRLNRPELLALVDGDEKRVVELVNEVERVRFEEKEAERRPVAEDEEALARPKDDERVVLLGKFCHNCGFRYVDSQQLQANFCSNCGSKRPRKE